MCPVTSHERPVAVQRGTDRDQPARTVKNTRVPRLTKRQLSVFAIILAAITGIAGAYFSRDRWLPQASQFLGAAQERLQDSDGDQIASDVALCEADSHAGGGETSLELSEQAVRV